MKILNLTLNKLPFDVMLSGEKNKEYRQIYNDDNTIKKGNRGKLYDKTSNYQIPKTYDYIKFINGYGNDKPYFIAKYISTNIINTVDEIYSNGLYIKYDKPLYCIEFGEIIEKNNIN